MKSFRKPNGPGPSMIFAAKPGVSQDFRTKIYFPTGISGPAGISGQLVADWKFWHHKSRGFSDMSEISGQVFPAPQYR